MWEQSMVTLGKQKQKKATKDKHILINIIKFLGTKYSNLRKENKGKRRQKKAILDNHINPD